jgi:hypothetical protein
MLKRWFIKELPSFAYLLRIPNRKQFTVQGAFCLLTARCSQELAADPRVPLHPTTADTRPHCVYLCGMQSNVTKSKSRFYGVKLCPVTRTKSAFYVAKSVKENISQFCFQPGFKYRRCA